MAELSPLRSSSQKHNATEFQLIKDDMYLPELKNALTEARAQLEKIGSSKEAPNLENTLLALESLDEDLSQISSLFHNQLSANTNETLQALAQEFAPLIAEFSNDVLLNEKIFERIKKIYEQKSSLNLAQEESQLLEKAYRDFTRNGALLNESQKKELRKIDSELSKLAPLFSDNVLKATNKFKLLITNKEELKGLPESVIEMAKHTAEELHQKNGWVFTLHAPSYIPFMQYAEHRPHRETLWRAQSSKAFKDEFDNQKNLIEILKLREKRAHLLGFKNHAEFVLKERMAESPEKVMSFLEKIKNASLPAARKELNEIEAYAKELGGPDKLKPWDFAFYSEKLKEKLFAYNSEDLRPYFKLENVVNGVFEHARKLYQIEFKPSNDYPVYHPDVKVFEVYDESSKDFIGLFYADFFPRDSKRGGAWMTNYQDQGLFKGQVRRPHVAIVCNFTKPTPSTPSLLNFDEVSTLFHEFGHALHSLLSQCRFRSLSGTNVYWDFVELPSQVMENWVYEQESLQLFAHHYKTGELIPMDLAKKIKESSKFLSGYQSLRQVTFGLVDMHWHTTPTSEIKDVATFEEKVTKDISLFPKEDGTNFSCSFNHIFSGGYSAGYYSYKWAEVLDADAFEYFLEKGLFDKEVAFSFKKNILSAGASDHPMNLYKKFRGREPDPDSLLKRDGLI